MFRSKLLGVIMMAAGLAFVANAEDVIVKIRPPHVVVERRGEPPSREHVWVSGYHRWDGHAYVWEAGRWDRPPHAGAHWEAHHWVHRNGGYVLVEGRWR
jgi:hypothetical protein